MVILQMDGDQLQAVIHQAIKTALSDTTRPAGNQFLPSPKDILSIEEAADFLNLAKPTVYSLTSRREIPFFKTGKKLYFKRSELLKWIEDGKKKTVRESAEEVLEYRAGRRKPKM